jgi:hypothetical protein
VGLNSLMTSLHSDQHVERRTDLAQYCLISRTCYLYAAPRIYEWVYIYTWHKGAKKRVIISSVPYESLILANKAL